MTMVWSSLISESFFFFLPNSAVTLDNLERLFRADVVVSSLPICNAFKPLSPFLPTWEIHFGIYLRFQLFVLNWQLR